MTKQQSALILLVKSALTGEPYKLPENFDLAEIFHVAKGHGVDVMAYYGAIHCGVDANSQVMREQRMRTYQSIAASEIQLTEIRRVLEAFEAHGIEHMPLKGVLLKALYPEAEMRKMGDADILIKVEQYETIRGIMKELGFAEKYESDHEFAWIKKPVLIELHRRLIPSYNKDYYRYYGDGWKLAKPVEGSSFRYSMDPQDELIYLFTHFAKHYRDAGIGIRHLVDFRVYRKHHPELNEEYIREELAKLQLLEFYDNIMNTIGVWFEDGSEDEKTELITQFIFTSGEFGRSYRSNLSSALKETKKGQSVQQIKRNRVLHVLFPGYIVMSRKYRILEKAPVLLPVMWVVRIFEKMSKTAKMRRFVNEQMNLGVDEVSAYQQSLNDVGLDFNFSE